MKRGKQTLIWKCAEGKPCEHCLYTNHGSDLCPLLYCRICKGYGHSAVVCERKKVPESQGLPETRKTYLEHLDAPDPIG